MSSPTQKVERFGKTGVIFFCPACKELHLVDDYGYGTFNGDLEEPSIDDGSSIYVGRFTDKACHFYMFQGRLYFWSDCGHGFACDTSCSSILPYGERDEPQRHSGSCSRH